MTNLVLMITLAMIGLMLAGCETAPEETRTYWTERIDRTEDLVASLTHQVVSIEASLRQVAESLADAPEGSELAERIRNEAAAGAEALAVLLERREILSDQVTAARDKLASLPADASSAEINAQMAGQSVAGVGAVLPPPWNLVAAALGTLIGTSGGLFGLIGKRRAEKAEQQEAEANHVLESTVSAIENAKRTNASLRKAFDESSSVIRTNLSNQAEVRVNEIRTAYGKAQASAVA